MPQEIDIRLLPEEAFQDAAVLKSACYKARVRPSEVSQCKVVRRSIDARQRQVVYQIRVHLYMAGESIEVLSKPLYQQVHDAQAVHIVGAGPAGMFAALHCLEHGLKPIILERGKDVRARRRDLAAIHKSHEVHPDSNYCFGEGGAGTYSDGKLYTRSKKRGDLRAVLEVLVHHGAPEDILVDVHPHIGTNKLPAIITEIRETILKYGGEVRFESKVTGIHTDAGQLSGLEVNGETEQVSNVILATGHSARDVFELLHKAGVTIEYKPFALGVRVEHPQALIDSAQYHAPVRNQHLPPASYSQVYQVEGRGVYSFCMCPGGIIAPCATSPGEVVTNGWSPSKRNNPYANSGIVTEVKWEDVAEFHDQGPLAGVAFQRAVEQRCQQAAGGTQNAPAQRLIDFVEGRASAEIPVNSYSPGTTAARVDQLMPAFVARSLKRAFKAFDKRMPGYLHPDAVVVAPESRTSSPVRIPREKESLQHPDAAGLYPCGEGAGYAGGIVSAAMDGRRCVLAIANKLSPSDL